MEWKFRKYRYAKLIRYTAYSVRRCRGEKDGQSYHFETAEACAAFCRRKNIPLPEGWAEPLPGTKPRRHLNWVLAQWPVQR